MCVRKTSDDVIQDFASFVDYIILWVKATKAMKIYEVV